MILFVMGSIQIPVHSLVVLVNFRPNLLKFIIHKRRILNEILVHSMNALLIRLAADFFQIKMHSSSRYANGLSVTILFAFVKV